jgi:hypothetical protein
MGHRVVFLSICGAGEMTRPIVQIGIDCYLACSYSNKKDEPLPLHSFLRALEL